jgi:acetyl-CoA acetyltransferase
VTSGDARAAIAGVGYTPFTRRSGRSVLDQALEACRNAVGDAGIETAQVDGIASFMLMHDSVPAVAVASGLALPGLRYVLDAQLGGQAPCYLVGEAATAVNAGHADYVLVFRALNGRSGPRVGTMPFAGAGGQYRYPIGYDAYLMYVAMWARRFLLETAQGEEDLAAVASTQRQWAAQNERALKRDLLSVAEHLAAPFVVEPFRADDCTLEVDGACAVLVTSLERARDLRHPPAVVAASAYRAGPRPGLDIGDHLLWSDYTRNYTNLLRDELFHRAGLGPSDVQLAEIYDCFTSTVLMGLEGLGLCERGGAGALVRAGSTSPAGSLPVNTHGGLLAEGYLHGMNTVTEAVLQVQGRGGTRQVGEHDVCVATSGALMDGSALVLTTDR